VKLMTDTVSTDMVRFFERYDRRQRLVFVAALSASLALSAVIIAYRVSATGATGATPAGFVWGLGIVFPPLFILGWWCFAALMARERRRSSPFDGRLVASADDARNGVRVASAGFAFNIGLLGAVVGQQMFWATAAFGHPVGDWIPRVTTIAVGVVTIYLGNLWPRMPTPRAPERTAAIRMKVNRFSGWLMVMVGLLAVLLGLFLPLLYPWMRHR
jgi:hypothetical protein